MRVYMNFSEVRGPYGGANSFLRALKSELRRRGIAVVTDVSKRFDVALLNALTDGIDATLAKSIRERGIPVVHRRVGYRASGPPEMRAADPDGVIRGDRLQLEFNPWVTHVVYQSAYSRDVFLAGGHDGPYTIIHNGVDERIYNQSVGTIRRRRRGFWSRPETLRVCVSTWSKDAYKGFPAYQDAGREAASLAGVELTLFGRAPDDVELPGFRLEGPFTARGLARRLKSQHVLLQLAQHETCSNALIEGINCGLAVIYLNSGANAELARPFGIEWHGSLELALDELLPSYDDLVAATAANPYRMTLVADRYVEVLERALA
jgi:hypothetical protein